MRQVKRGKKGQKQTVTEYYHRAVVAQLLGFELPLALDLEMIRPGEGETTAAKRLIERLMSRYARFFDAIVGDALYWDQSLFDLCQKHKKRLVAVLKKNNRALLDDARSLLVGQPDLVTNGGKGQRHIQYWDQEGFTSGSIQAPVRVVRTVEEWIKRERIACQWVETPMNSEWFWATDIPRAELPTRQLAQVGHERWKIENQIFNALRAWGLNHCYHHQPQAIENFLLILFIAHAILSCFHLRSLKKEARRIYSTLLSLARMILKGICLLKAGDVPGNRGSPRGD